MLISLVVSVAAILYAPHLLTLMGASASVVRIGGNYLRVLLHRARNRFRIAMANAGTK